MGEGVQLYINVDAEGNVTGTYSGKNIVATEEYNYFFIVEEEVADQAGLYKVVINEMVPELVLKDET